jgi:hypothetical protein
MMTINGLCLASITDFMEEMIDIKRQYGHRYPTMTLNLLRFPSFQSPAILPDNIKTMYKEKLETWLAGVIAKGEKDKEGVKLFTDMEIAHVQRLIDYLDVIKTPHRNTADQDKLYNDFKNFYLQYDVRRGKHFRSTFPQEFVDFIDNIDVPVPSKEEILSQQYRDEVGSVGEMEGDPATTEGGYISDEVSHGWNTKTDELGANEQ